MRDKMKIKLTFDQKKAIMTEVRLDVEDGLIKNMPQNIDRRYKACTAHVTIHMRKLNVQKYAEAIGDSVSINFSTLETKGINVDELIKTADANRDNVSHYSTTAGLNSFTLPAAQAQEIAFRAGLKDMLKNI